MPGPQLRTSYWPADVSQPVLETTIGGVLADAAVRAPDVVALVGADPDPARRREWSYGGLFAGAQRAARGLLERFEPGERIAVWAGNCPEWVQLEFAAGLAGLTIVPVNPAYQADELAHVLAHSSARGIVIAAEYRGRSLPAVLAEVRHGLPELRHVMALDEWDQLASTNSDCMLPQVDPGSPAQILYTSGTTGRPKAAALTHRGLTNNARLDAEAIGMRAGEAFVNPMPMFHVAGCCMMTLGIVQTAGTHVLMPYFDPGLQLELIESYRSAVFGGVPTMLTALLSHPDASRRDLSCLRYAISGGAPVPADLVARVEEMLGIPFLITFAQTEASCSITLTRPGDAPGDRRQSVGRPLPQTEVKIAVPGTGQTAPIGAIGEICTRGYHVMTGYLGDPMATASAIDEDGWLHTGDLGAMNERGYCRVEGRLKDMIIRGGENIYPREIEAVLLSHPRVAEVAVVGVADWFWGEVVGAVIRPLPEHAPPAEAELGALCRDRLASFKIPVRWLFLDSLPLTATGKICKDQLSEQLAERPAVIGVEASRPGG
ncbi:MAG: AMP-binding protein [Nocardiopsaceae bacterium]|jgi:fatty-acyl-CoA synthase|nr:AMP-binding protein [Nocardiopsaceae bacterium]